MASPTTYAEVADLLPLVGIASGESYDSARLQRLLNTAARLFDKETRRFIVEGYEAYAATASTIRLFDDYLGSLELEIPDALTITAITRGSTTLAGTEYMLLPATTIRGNGPITHLQFQQGVSISYDTEDHAYYGTHSNQFITNGIAITGTWGYCTEANRPDAVTEAVLQWAAIMYKTGAVSAEALLQMATVNGPMQFMAAGVKDIIRAFKRMPAMRFV
jgi:hypothetical protein